MGLFEISTWTSAAGESFWISLETLLYMTLQYRAREMTPSCGAGSIGRKFPRKWILAVGDRALATSSNFLKSREIGALAKISNTGRAGLSWWLTSLQFVGPFTQLCWGLEQASTGINSLSHSVSSNWYFYLFIIIYWTNRIFEVEQFSAVVVDGFLVMGLPLNNYCAPTSKLLDQVLTNIGHGRFGSVYMGSVPPAALVVFRPKNLSPCAQTFGQRQPFSVHIRGVLDHPSFWPWRRRQDESCHRRLHQGRDNTEHPRLEWLIWGLGCRQQLLSGNWKHMVGTMTFARLVVSEPFCWPCSSSLSGGGAKTA